MVYRAFTQILAIIALLLSQASYATEAVDAMYQLKEGDTLQISVWGDQAMNREVRVLPDGSITYPLAGRVEAKGLTAPQLEATLTEKLKRYYPEPQITVSVSGTDGNRVFVVGKVSNPGPVLVNRPITVLQALSMAGSLDRFACKEEIKVVRPTPQGDKVFNVNYKELIQGRNLQNNIVLQAGDTILVP